VILSVEQAANVLQQCSRSSSTLDGTWTVTPKDVELLEQDLLRLNGMKARGCCIMGWRLENVDSYLRQYVGIVVEGRRYIYINAFPVDTFDDWPAQAEKLDWKREPFHACDGGGAFWGVLYDPATRRFSQLAFNGIG
jgi:hypothetical protein